MRATRAQVRLPLLREAWKREMLVHSDSVWTALGPGKAEGVRSLSRAALLLRQGQALAKGDGPGYGGGAGIALADENRGLAIFHRLAERRMVGGQFLAAFHRDQQPVGHGLAPDGADQFLGAGIVAPAHHNDL